MTTLNARAMQLVEPLAEQPQAWGAELHHVGGTRVLDLGVHAPGGLEVGKRLAEISLAGLGEVAIIPDATRLGSGYTDIEVRTDHPLAACMASQYAGWQIALDNYFAMGSGPMRAAAAKEELFDEIGCVEKPDAAVGVLETAQLPTEAACRYIAAECGVEMANLTLLSARTASMAGTVQIVARSVETAMHKLHELGFDLHSVQRGFGSAPLPPVADDDLTGIGRTNDAILYGGEVTLQVRGDDASLQTIGPLVPSCSSRDHGVPFAEIFERYDRDFYQIDGRLFSPAVITLANVDTGASFRFGQLMPEVLQRSFGDRS